MSKFDHWSLQTSIQSRYYHIADSNPFIILINVEYSRIAQGARNNITYCKTSNVNISRFKTYRCVTISRIAREE